MFSPIYNLLKEAANKVDWLVLAFYGTLDDGEIKDAAIVHCSNKTFDISMRRQKLFKTEYLGFNKSEPFIQQHGMGDFEEQASNDVIHYSIETSESRDYCAMFFNAFEETPRALNLMRHDEPFTATLNVQMIYELVIGATKKFEGEITFDDVKRMFSEIDVTEKHIRFELFGQKYGLITLNDN